MNASRRLSRKLRTTPGGLALVGVVYLLLTAGLTSFLDDTHLLNVALVYLLVCLLSAAYWGYVVGLISACAADLLVNFFFVEPVHTFTVQNSSSLIALLLFLAVATVGASMLSLLRREANRAAAGEAEASLLLHLTQEAASAVTPRDAMERLCTAITRAVGAKGCAMLRKGDEWSVVASCGDAGLTRAEANLAEQALASGETVRFGGAVRARIPSMPRRSIERSLTFVPFRTPNPGVLKIDGPIAPPRFVSSQRLLRAFANEAGVAEHRARLADEARRVETLQEADEFKSALLSSVSHDLRSPLTAIKASVGSLRDRQMGWSEEDTDGFLETIDSQTDRLTATVTNLLEMSRLEGGAARPRIEAIEARLLLDDAIVAAGESLAGRTVTNGAGEDIWLRADYGLVLQSVVNLLENAGKYSSPGCPVALGADRRGGRARLTISDEGPGFSPADASHIFEKFYRGSRSACNQGSGLGLSIAKAMVEICGGSVGATSSPDGTVFAIELPAVEPPRS